MIEEFNFGRNMFERRFEGAPLNAYVNSAGYIAGEIRKRLPSGQTYPLIVGLSAVNRGELLALKNALDINLDRRYFTYLSNDNKNKLSLMVMRRR